MSAQCPFLFRNIFLNNISNPSSAIATPLREELFSEFPINEELGLEFPENEFAPEFPENEFAPEFVPEWNLIPDGDGKMHLANLHEEQEPEIAPLWNVNTDVIFRLFTSSNPTTGQVLTVGNAASITNSNFVAGNPTR